MIHGKQNKNKKGYLKRYLSFQMRHKGTILCLGLIFLLGVIFGCRMEAAGSEIFDILLQKLFMSGSVAAKDQNFFRSVCASFIANGVLLFFLFICGFCAISQPLILSVLLFKGLGFGLMGGYLYGSGEKSSVLYYVLLLLPEMLFSISLLIVAAKEALDWSKLFLNVLLTSSCNRNGNGEEHNISLQAYCMRFLVLVLLDGVLSVLVGLMQTAYFLLLG